MLARGRLRAGDPLPYGAGLILGGTVYRGDRGAAGDLGHVRIQAAAGVLCRCGNYGCLEAVAGGPALAARLSASGLPAAGSPAFRSRFTTTAIAWIREEIYRRSTALATERLRITESRLGARAGIEGCAVLALDELLSPRALDKALTARDQQQIA